MLHECKQLQSLRGLENCNQLTHISLPKQVVNLDRIRRLPKLTKLSLGKPATWNWTDVPPVREYWPKYDQWRRGNNLR